MHETQNCIKRENQLSDIGNVPRKHSVVTRALVDLIVVFNPVMADILDQPDNDIDLYGDGELDGHYSERDVLGDDDDDLTRLACFYLFIKS
ncbi:unnamed protein product [Thelazia callipaeda]|uniref:Uncharacterized protein n=1 Tax=Thelazia callipaeda TaxID=103827 RepID=A0A0N5DBK2_THECL|nr:unnamed protein product [Thelazia callipaeda]